MMHYSGFKALTKAACTALMLLAAAPALAQTVEDGLALRADGEFEQAFAIFDRLAREGDVQAQVELGTHYWRGWGVEPDFDESFRWYVLAAEQGSIEAELELAYAYWDGIGTPIDREEGLRRFIALGEQGYRNAQFALGRLYRDGDGVAADTQEAIRWFSLAAAQGDEWARQELSKLTGEFDVSAPNCAALYSAIAISQVLAEQTVMQFAPVYDAANEMVNSTFGFLDLSGNGGGGRDGLDQAWREQGWFWAFSNAREIDFGARLDTLRDRAENELAFDIAMAGFSGPRFPSPISQEAGFGSGRITNETPYPLPEATPPYGQWITSCDETHGFTPVFAFGAKAGPDHLACIVTYWSVGLLNPAAQAATTPRVQFASQSMIQAEAGLTLDTIRARAQPLVETKVTDIRNAPETFDALLAEARACDADYGHGAGNQ